MMDTVLRMESVFLMRIPPLPPEVMDSRKKMDATVMMKLEIASSAVSGIGWMKKETVIRLMINANPGILKMDIVLAATITTPWMKLKENATEMSKIPLLPEKERSPMDVTPMISKMRSAWNAVSATIGTLMIKNARE